MALTITVSISDADQKILENDLIDVEDWVQKAVVGKINSCRKRMAREWAAKMKSDPAVSMIPADDDALIVEAIKRPDYKSRADREAERVAKEAAEAAAKRP